MGNLAALELKGVHFSYQGEGFALENINLLVEEKDFLIILGPNGGGKSTLLKLIVGLLTPQQGEIKIFGAPQKGGLDRIGYLSQTTEINPNFPITALEVVLMGLLGGGKRPWFVRAKERRLAEEMLDQVGVADLKGRRVGSLSGGQRQRVLIARALMTKPDLLLLDEPTASIDAAAKAGFYELLKQVNQDITIVMISHDFNIIPTCVKSVACVNRTLFHHNAPQLTQEMLTMTYGCDDHGHCPVELVAHGIPHRVLSEHSHD